MAIQEKQEKQEKQGNQDKREDSLIQDVMAAIQQEPDTDERIGRFLREYDGEFPDAASIEVDSGYRNPFEIPAFLDRENYKYAWLDPEDDIQMYNALENGFFKIVTRSSSCIKDPRKADPYFRSHGAIELQRMILAFRPTDLDNRIRQIPVIQHKAMTEAVVAGKEAEGYETSFDKYRGDFDKKDAGKISHILYKED